MASAPLFVDLPIIGLLQTLKFQESADFEFLETVPSQYEVNTTLQFGDVPSMTLQLNANDFSGTVVSRNNSSNPPSKIYLAKNPQSQIVEFVGLDTYFNTVAQYDYEINYEPFMDSPTTTYSWKKNTANSFLVTATMKVPTQIVS